jgi:hypothetical protein
MKPSFLLLLLISTSSCRTDHISLEKNIPGDYTQGEDGWGWQLRLYPDSTFFFQNNVFFEMYPSWQGKWSLVSRHPLLLKLDLQANPDTSPLRVLSPEYYLLSSKWTIEILNADLIKLKADDSTNGPILKRGTLHVNYDDSKIYAITHQSK